MDNFKKYIPYLIVIGVLMFAIIAYTFGTYHPNQNSTLFQKYLQTQLDKEKEKYKQIIESKEIKIEELSKELDKSNQQMKKTQTEINKLKSKINDIKTPENLSEVRERLNKLGYSTN